MEKRIEKEETMILCKKCKDIIINLFPDRVWYGKCARCGSTKTQKRNLAAIIAYGLKRNEQPVKQPNN